MKTVWKITLVVAGLAVILQFVLRPDRDNPVEDPSLVITAQVSVPPDVRAILERSCFDCHSNRTQWPWYSAVAPVSWLVAHDVEEGRKHLNFSEWGTYTRKRQASRLDMISSEVDKGEMPPGNYLLLHRDAVLSDSEKDRLCTWVEELSDSLLAPVE